MEHLAWKFRLGQSTSAGSGQSAAHAIVLQIASGFRAHQMCSVEMWPWRIDFSRRAWAEMRLIGKSTSMRRLGYGGGMSGYVLSARRRNWFDPWSYLFRSGNLSLGNISFTNSRASFRSVLMSATERSKSLNGG